MGFGLAESSAPRRRDRVDRSIARAPAIASIARIRPLRDPHTDARDRIRPGARSTQRDVAPRDSTAIARRGGARAERRSTARDGDDARDTRVARRATGTAHWDAAEATGGDDRGRAREGREARANGDGWAQLRDVRRSEDVEMAKDG